MGWNVSQTKASFKHGSLELLVRTQPSLGIDLLHEGSTSSWEIRPSEDSVEAASPTPAPEEAYARLDDFIVRYPQKFPWPFSYQLDVRVQASPSNLLVAELWLSVQTSMLECNPQLVLSPSSGNLPWSCHPEFLCSADRRSALAIHPLDTGDCQVHSNRSGDVQHVDLFGRFMEKGVIRRGRLLLVASTNSISEQQMSELCKTFANSELPLTA